MADTPIADENTYVELKSEKDDGRILHLMRVDWEKWGKPSTIEQMHANRRALDAGQPLPAPPPADEEEESDDEPEVEDAAGEG
jgi:hypothetical protein